MPQMAPLNWLALMIMFILILTTFNIKNFFSFSQQIKQTPQTTSTPKINWKW